jgi:hypothetical protein
LGVRQGGDGCFDGMELIVAAFEEIL